MGGGGWGGQTPQLPVSAFRFCLVYTKCLAKAPNLETNIFLTSKIITCTIFGITTQLFFALIKQQHHKKCFIHCSRIMFSLVNSLLLNSQVRLDMLTNLYQLTGSFVKGNVLLVLVDPFVDSVYVKSI